eukprot:1138581-Lingulodinium_polyedra.AAC.1
MVKLSMPAPACSLGAGAGIATRPSGSVASTLFYKHAQGCGCNNNANLGCRAMEPPSTVVNPVEFSARARVRVRL